MSEYLPKPKCSWGGLKVELDLPNYATKADLTNATGVDTSKFVKTIDLADSNSDADKLDIDKLKCKWNWNVPSNLSNFKIRVDKLNIDKLVNAPVDLGQLSNVVENYVVKKDVHNAKINDITNLATNTTLNAKINEVTDETPHVTN